MKKVTKFKTGEIYISNEHTYEENCAVFGTLVADALEKTKTDYKSYGVYRISGTDFITGTISVSAEVNIGEEE